MVPSEIQTCHDTPAPPPEAKDRLKEIAAALYPELTGEERAIAEANLWRYFEIALLVGEEAERPRGHLTASAPLPSMKERSNADLKT